MIRHAPQRGNYNGERALRKFLRDVVGVTISRRELARIIAKVSRALERPYQELLDDLPAQARLNVDETGHKQNGDRQWTWCFRAALDTLFKMGAIPKSGDTERPAGRIVRYALQEQYGRIGPR
ncbi:hypothetical protein BH23PLA1_BH23PLA1_30930 [soil metagenome]